jgi:hypothetical protein
MKRIALAFIAAAAFAAGSARADHVSVRGSISFGSPGYYAPAPVYVAPSAPVYCAPAPRGYWQNTEVKVWVPARWVTTYDRWGRPYNQIEPAHLESHIQRVWVDADANRGWMHGRRDYRRGWNG